MKTQHQRLILLSLALLGAAPMGVASEEPSRDSFAAAVATLKAQAALSEPDQRPVCLYLGSAENRFSRDVLGRPEVKEALASFIYARVSLYDEVSYPLTGATVSGEDLANLLGAPAGSIVFLDGRGVVIPNLTTTRLTLGHDPALFRDLLDYVASREYRTLSIQEHAVVAGTQARWLAALERGRRLLPVRRVGAEELRGIPRPAGRAFVLTRDPEARVSRALLGEIEGAVVVSMADPVPGEPAGTPWPVAYLSVADGFLEVTGYVPAPLLGVSAAEGFMPADKDLPIGELDG
ncbi:MAG: hypothetical protein HY722_04775 [Planctomycetes bacterium]|nr:hypothetical protein [Planctomycetota bacterium]